MEEHEINDPENTFRALMDKLTEELGHLGIHTEVMSIMGAPIFDEDEDSEAGMDLSTEQMVGKIKDSQGHFGIAIRAELGRLVWDERTLDPEGFSARQTEEIVMPTEQEMIQAEVKAWIEEHGSLEGFKMPDIFKADFGGLDDIQED